MNCKYCQSDNVVRFGTYNGIQRYFCNSCNRKFTLLDTLPKMKTPIPQIASALNMYYSGMSLDAIQGQLKQDYSSELSQIGIYKWIIRFTKDAIQRGSTFRPKLGNTWIADETDISVNGKRAWFWDIIDKDSRYLIASYLSFTREMEDAQVLIEQAMKHAGKVPETIITDRLASYVDAIDIATNNKTHHIQSKPFTDKDSTNTIERFHGTLKDRTKVIRGFKDMATAQLITDGFLVHYNFFRPHESLDDKTPAEYTGVSIPFKSWLEVVRTSKTTGDYTVKAIIIDPIAKPRTKAQLKREYIRKAVRRHMARDRGRTEAGIQIMRRGRKPKEER